MTRSLFVLLAATFLASATVASASSREKRHDRDRHHRRELTPNPTAEAAYRSTCGACHAPYAPHLLSADSWRVVLRNLDRHFGQTVELDGASRQEVEGWLTSAPRSSEKATTLDNTGVPPRITTSAWFQKKHRKIAPAVVQRPSVGTMSNCAACHRGALAWDFDEHSVMIPPK